MRKVLAIPLEEVREHFALNSRQDVKIVAPEILAGELIAKLKAAGRAVKPERPLEGVEWRHAASDAPNALCESREFAAGLAEETSGPFALCFANEKGRRTLTITRIIWKSIFPSIRWKQNTASTRTPPLSA